MPEPVVPDGLDFVARSGVPFVFPLWPPTAGSVGDCVVGLTLGPDWFAGAGALWAKAKPADAATIKAAIAILRVDIFEPPWLLELGQHRRQIPVPTSSGFFVIVIYNSQRPRLLAWGTHCARARCALGHKGVFRSGETWRVSKARFRVPNTGPSGPSRTPSAIGRYGKDVGAAGRGSQARTKETSASENSLGRHHPPANELRESLGRRRIGKTPRQI